jgi:glutamate synthase (NADPH) small chain
MGELGGFLRIHRQDYAKRPISERVKDFKEYAQPRPEQELRDQGARCMDCGIPFCHQGCPLGNLIPDWNDAVYRGRWDDALAVSRQTNNFPEFTGRICPAPCEAACVLDINDDAVTIKMIEQAISDRAWAEGWVKPQPPASRSSGRDRPVWRLPPSSTTSATRSRCSSAMTASAACCATASPTSSSRSGSSTGAST